MSTLQRAAATAAKVPWLWHSLASAALATAAAAAITAADITQGPGDLYVLKKLGYLNGYGPLHNAAVFAAGLPGDFNATYPLLIVPAFAVLAWGLHTLGCARLIYVCLPVLWFPLRYGHVEEIALTGLALAAAASPRSRAWVHVLGLALKPTAAAYCGASLRARPLLLAVALCAAAVHTIATYLPRAGIPNGEELWTLPIDNGPATTALRASWVVAALVIGALWDSTPRQRLHALTAVAVLRAGSEITVFAYYLTPAAVFGAAALHLALQPAKSADISSPEIPAPRRSPATSAGSSCKTAPSH